MRSRSAGALVAVLLLAGCAGGDDGTVEGDGGQERVTTGTTGVTAEPTGVTAEPTGAVDATAEPGEGAVDLDDELNDEALRDQARWVLGLLEEGATGPRVEESQERFTAEFLAAVPAVQLGLVFGQLRAQGPFVVTEVQERSGLGPPAAQLRLTAEPQDVLMTLELDGEGRIGGLLFAPDTSGEGPELSSWADLDEALAELGGTTQVFAAEVVDGSCRPLHTTAGLPDGGEPAPSGSVFKLLVLTALADRVAAGELAWEDELTITDEVKSLPSGVLQDRPDGSVVTAAEAAELMISISDNTATDLLVAAVGQPALGAAAEDAGLDLQRVLPVVTTRQLFQLGWQVGPDVRAAWADAGEPAEREAILDDLPTGLDLDPAAVTDVVWPQGVEYLLTGAEICSLHARLQQQATTAAGEPIRGILSANPGTELPEGVTYQGFKGGSSPGVVALSFYLEAGQGAAGRVLVVQVRAEDDVDVLRAATITEAGLRHLAAAEG